MKIILDVKIDFWRIQWVSVDRDWVCWFDGVGDEK